MPRMSITIIPHAAPHSSDKHHNRRRSRPCRSRYSERAGRGAEHRSTENENRHTQTRSRTDSKNIWPGKRITEQGLHLQACTCKSRTGKHCHNCFDKPYIAHNNSRSSRHFAAGKRRQYIRQGNICSAMAKIYTHQQRQQQKKNRECDCLAGHCSRR